MIDVSLFQSEIIMKILQKYVSGCEVRAFGSRVTWTAKDYSDLDIAIVGKEKLSGDILFSIKEAFQESDLPFRVDVLDWHSISKEFRAVIEKKYEVIQKKPLKTRFKKTEIGKIPEDWRLEIFSKVISVNPKRILKKSAIAKKVSMQKVFAGQRKINGFEVGEYGGGARFQNNDTLMARITPCLENGKIAFVDILDDEEVAFGSTEFNVLSGKEGISNDIYVYYLSKSPFVLLETISSMVGTSGRQRVQNVVFDNILIPVPPFSEQKAIAKILSDLDSKIELNQQMNKTLESIGQALFKRWFVDFEFPDENGNPYKTSSGEMVDSELGKIPKGWQASTLKEIIKITSGKRPSDKSYVRKSEFNIPLIGASSIMGYVRECLYTEPILIIGRVGTHGIVQRVSYPAFPSDNTLVIKSHYYNFVFHSLKRLDYSSLNVGTTQPLITQSGIKQIEIIIPQDDILSKFEKTLMALYKSIDKNLSEIETLSQIRDSLLPRLMSGRMRVCI
ncbi:MAG: restriction endonuclease subunit S [Candidatus Omnitrophica bacterium]|nr:restriction endonuclease subunit S [Candidatus Omnitrophota bacterium]